MRLCLPRTASLPRPLLQPGNVTVNVRTITNADGRYGANDRSINYAASIAMTNGNHIIYGFYGK